MKRGGRDSPAEETAHSKAWRGHMGRRTVVPQRFLIWDVENRAPFFVALQDLGQELVLDGE